MIRDIYRRCAIGEGARTIAGALNRAGVPKPRAQQGRKDGWSVSTIRAVLTRPLYRGEVVYGRTAKACNNTLALPIDETDDTILDIIEGEVLGTKYIRELLSMVESAPDETEQLTAERERLQTEIDNLVKSIAAGVPPETVAPSIQERQSAIRRVDARLRVPTVTSLDRERLKAALEQRAKEWKRELRAAPQIGRLVLRRLVGPLVLHDESERPDFVKWEAQPTAGLLDGLTPPIWMASLSIPSCNQIASFLESMRQLRDSTGFAA